MSHREYLGDGVYADFDGFQIWLETSDGVRTTNRIALDDRTYAALLDYNKRLLAHFDRLAREGSE